MVGLVRDGVPENIFVRALNLSWNGAMLRVPNVEITKKESIVLRLPCGNNEAISARAEVVWSSLVDDQSRLIGVQFTNLRVADEKKLKRLLSMLALSQSKTKHNTRIPREVEIHTADRGETIDTLEQIRAGRVETTLFGSIPTDEPFPLAVDGFGDMPVLRLRARASSQEAVGWNDSADSLRMYRVTLTFEHPESDLKSVTEPLIAALRARDAAVAFDVA
jgi:hypothetical protein